MITLTTDFGLRDSFVAEMKGVILRINSQVTLIDLCHKISPQNVREAAFVLHTTYHYFPLGTIHLVVLDPGGGNTNRPIVVQTEKYTFVGPDNGVFSYVTGTRSDRGEWLMGQRQAIHLTNQRFWLPKISPTFRGRDIFAPVAAHLSLGVPLTDLGQSIDNLMMYQMTHPELWSDGRMTAHVLYIDRFGNVITDITEHMLEHKKQIQIEVAGQRLREIYRAYLEVAPGELVALIGSSGYLEISIREGNAATNLNVQVGDPIHIRAV